MLKLMLFLRIITQEEKDNVVRIVTNRRNWKLANFIKFKEETDEAWFFANVIFPSTVLWFPALLAILITLGTKFGS
jgi:hypothetical protein